MLQSFFIDGHAAWHPVQGRPAPQRLAANERRRAGEAVLLALQVADAAVAASGHAAATLASVFASAHGDLGVTDALCRTLADNPLALSPTRFHHSVHNAASGYWAIAAGSRAASTALAAGAYSFAAGLLEAAVQCASEAAPVLLVCSDTAAVGPLASVNSSREALALALVLAPRPGPASRWRVGWHVESGAAAAVPDGNPTAAGLALFTALASGPAATMALPLGPALRLVLAVERCGMIGAATPSPPPPDAAA